MKLSAEGWTWENNEWINEQVKWVIHGHVTTGSMGGQQYLSHTVAQFLDLLLKVILPLCSLKQGVRLGQE